MTTPRGKRGQKPGAHNLVRYADTVRLLMQKPRTTMEVAELTGASRWSVRAWLNALAYEGLAKVKPGAGIATGGRQPDVYTWIGLDE